MHRLLITLVSLFLVASPFELAACARAGIPIIWGQGEDVAEVGDLPPDVKEEIVSEIGQDVSVGYMYSRFHIYYADMWTWNGRHVLVHEDQYWSVDDSQWELMLGGPVESKFGKPFSYRFPLGATLLASIIVLSYAVPRVFPSDERKLEKLSRDSRYTRALEKILPNGDHALRTQYKPDDVDLAVVDLTGQGISEPKARRNLELMLSTVCAAREIQITELFDIAHHLAESGSPAQGLTIVEQLVKALPLSDPRYQDATQLLSKLQDKVARAAEAETSS